MQFIYVLLATLLVVPAWGQATTYHDANLPGSSTRQRAAIAQQPAGLLNQGQYDVGFVQLPTGRRVLLPGLRYHVGLRLLQVQDSVQTDSLRYWPLATLRGFDLGDPDAAPLPGQPAAPVRRYRSRLVSENHGGTRREAVEVLTATDSGPLLLGWLPVLGEGGRLDAVLLAGPGADPTQPLRPLELTQAAVLRYCGSRADLVRHYASTKNLSYSNPQHVAQLFDYYNQFALVKN